MTRVRAVELTDRAERVTTGRRQRPERRQQRRGVDHGRLDPRERELSPVILVPLTWSNRWHETENFPSIRPLGSHAWPRWSYRFPRVRYPRNFMGVGDAQACGNLGEGRA